MGTVAKAIGITAGPDGNLWFAGFNDDKIGRITPQGVVTEFSAGISPGAGLYDIAAGADGNLWFTEAGLDRIGRITPLGVVTEFSAGITPGAVPVRITNGPDGNLWFTEEFGDRTGRITPAGVVTEFSAGISAGAGPLGITAGPDGNLWFTEFFGSRIGRITTGIWWDVFWRHGSGTNATWQYVGSGASQFATGFPPGVPQTWQAKGTGDIDGNGVPDVVWFQPSSGLVAVWRMDSPTGVTAVTYPAAVGAGLSLIHI